MKKTIFICDKCGSSNINLSSENHVLRYGNVLDCDSLRSYTIPRVSREIFHCTCKKCGYKFEEEGETRETELSYYEIWK